MLQKSHFFEKNMCYIHPTFIKETKFSDKNTFHIYGNIDLVCPSQDHILAVCELLLCGK